VSRELLAEEAQKKLEPTALSCFLNTAACNLKMELWQEALDSCNEVRLLEGGGGSNPHTMAHYWLYATGRIRYTSYLHFLSIKVDVSLFLQVKSMYHTFIYIYIY